MKIKLLGMMMALICFAMMGGASATEQGIYDPIIELPDFLLVNNITITVTLPSADFRSEPVYNENNVKLLGYSMEPTSGDSVVHTYYFRGKAGEKIIMNQYEPGKDVPIATIVYIIPGTIYNPA